MSMALPLMRRRGPGIRPWSMASRIAVSAEPAPSVPMSRSAVKPASRSALAACSARMVRHGTDSSHGLQIFGAGMQEEMDVRVDQAGHQRGVAEVDDLRALRMLNRFADGANAFALDQDFAGLKQSCRYRPGADARRGARWEWVPAVRGRRPPRGQVMRKGEGNENKQKILAWVKLWRIRFGLSRVVW